jgi:hypothetical protein
MTSFKNIMLLMALLLLLMCDVVAVIVGKAARVNHLVVCGDTA